MSSDQPEALLGKSPNYFLNLFYGIFSPPSPTNRVREGYNKILKQRNKITAFPFTIRVIHTFIHKRESFFSSK